MTTPQKQPLSGGRGFLIVTGAMFGIIAVLWIAAWLLS
jgi:flagellar biogenesis protein FliO